MNWDPHASEVENARRNLPALAAEFIRQGGKVVAAKSPPEELHRFRLEAKRFRYTLELFISCYGPGLKDRLATLRKMQTYLGDINDCVAARALLKGRARAPKEFLAFLDARVAGKTSEFREYWQQTFAAAGREKWWVDYLSRFARSGRRPPSPR